VTLRTRRAYPTARHESQPAGVRANRDCNRADHRTELRSGEAFRQQLTTLMREAVSVVFVLSSHSAASPTARGRVNEVVRFQKRILPVVCKSLDGGSTPERLEALSGGSTEPTEVSSAQGQN